MRLLFSSCCLVASLAFAQGRPPAAPPAPPAVPAPQPMVMMGGPGGLEPGMGMGMGPMGIPPHLAQKYGVPPETVKKARDLAFDAQDAFITLKATLERAHLDLARAMVQPAADEAQLFPKLEAVSKAELEVKKNRLGLMLKLKKLVGAETWEKLKADLPGLMGHEGGPGLGVMMGPPGRGPRHEGHDPSEHHE